MSKRKKRAVEIAPSLRSYRTAELLGEYQIRSDGDGRTVEAYAVPFDVPAEVIDVEGHYFEEFKRGAFARQLNRGFAGIPVLYNHGRDIYMRPSDRFAMPIGTPIEIREDGPGLFTATRFAGTELGDEVLQLVRDGALSHYSIQFARTPAGKGTKRTRNGHASGLDLVQRLDVRLIEYGPSPIPVYTTAGVTGLRAEQIAGHIQDLDEAERANLSELLRADSDLASAAGKGSGHEHEETSVVSAELLALRHEQLLRTREIERNTK